MINEALPLRALCLCALLAAAIASSPGRAENRLYLRGGLGIDRSTDTEFQDRDCASTDPPALFGCAIGDDGRPIAARGDFGMPLALEAGIGYRFLPAFRGEALISYRPDLEFSGNANFLATPDPQPVSTDVRSLTGMLVGYLDLPGIAVPTLGPLAPFIGAGIGLSRHDVDSVAYAFPGLGANATTVIRGGTHTSLSFMLTAGAALRLSERLTLDIAYRYLDLGKVRTDAGSATITRPGFSTTLDIDGTEADLRTHGLSVSLRLEL